MTAKFIGHCSNIIDCNVCFRLLGFIDPVICVQHSLVSFGSELGCGFNKAMINRGKLNFQAIVIQLLRTELVDNFLITADFCQLCVLNPFRHAKRTVEYEID